MCTIDVRRSRLIDHDRRRFGVLPALLAMGAVVGGASSAWGQVHGIALGPDDDAGSHIEEFQIGARWAVTATDGPTGPQGDPITLRWSIVPDGTTIVPTISGESDNPSSLISFFDGLYGDGGGGGGGGGGSSLADRPWFPLFDRSFERWDELSGISYVYEPNDDGQPINGNSFDDFGTIGVRGDSRIGGHAIGGSTLAYNYLPNNGEMVIDTSKGGSFDSPLVTRNVVTHEAGHGFGLRHIESSNARFLMEPLISTAFDGPQFDDILGVQRNYGDVLEEGTGNDTFTTATAAGTFAAGGSYAIGTDGDTGTTVAPSETDFVSVDDDSDTDFFSFTVSEFVGLDALLTPEGPTYQEGPQGGTQTTMVASALSDLVLAILGTDGTTPLVVSDDTGAGSSESITGLELNPGTYFARVTGKANNIQMYSLNLDFIAIPEPATLLLLGVGSLLLATRQRRAA